MTKRMPEMPVFNDNALDGLTYSVQYQGQPYGTDDVHEWEMSAKFYREDTLEDAKRKAQRIIDWYDVETFSILDVTGKLVATEEDLPSYYI